MARSMKEVNVGIFEGFKRRAREFGIGKVVEKVCIETDLQEKRFIKHAKHVEKMYTYWGAVISYEFDGVVYFALIDVSLDKELNVGVVDEIEPDAGFFTLVGNDVDLFDVPGAVIYELYDKLLSEYDHPIYDSNGIRFLPVGELASYVRPVRLFKLENGEEGSSNNFYRVAASLFSESVKDNQSDREGFYKEVLRLCAVGSDLIPYDCIANSVISIGWQHVFLELYRCVEYLYGIPESKRLEKKIESGSSAAKLLESLRNEIKWRPKEEVALANVFECLSEARLERLALALNHEGSYKPGPVASSFYALRNSVVHFRSGQERAVFSDEKWQEICVSLCEIILDCYVAYESELIVGKEGVNLAEEVIQ